LFDGENLQGPVYCLYSPPPEVTLAAMGALPQDAMVGATQMNGAVTGMPQGMGVGGQSMDMGMTGMNGGFPESGANMMNGDMQQFQQQQQQAQPQVIE
jgi:hypothetical protein